MSEFSPYLFILTGLVFCSAFFSGTEVAMFSLRRVDRQQLTKSKTKIDMLIVSLLARPRRLIATILIGNECINVAVSATSAGLIQRLFSDYSDIQKGIFATFLALPMLLFLGEITPKTLAMKKPMRWARKATQPLWIFGSCVAPLRWIVLKIANLLMLPLGLSTENIGPPDLSEEEFKVMVDAGRHAGVIAARERRLIHRVFAFGEKTVQEIMTPQKNVFSISYDLPFARLIKTIAERGYSRIPVFHKSQSHIKGILYAKDLVSVAAGEIVPAKLSELLHAPLFVPQTTPLGQLFAIFKKGLHLALVVNEYGHLVGLVTMEDVLEELFGEIRDERESLKNDDDLSEIEKDTTDEDQAIEVSS